MITKWSMRDVFEFAKAAHEGQVRKFSGEPYINHPVRVSLMATEHGLGHTAVAAALLHDVVEDCDVSLDEITERFGRHVAGVVWGLTNYEARNGGPDDTMNRADRKAVDCGWLSAQDPTVKSLKIIDCIDNILDQPSDGSFMGVMLEEMRLLVLAMTEPSIDGATGGVSPDLIDRFWDVWEDAAEEVD
jgi:(p)ppGpp synthase/HD superfamily hydrolase